MSKRVLCKFFAHGECLKGEHCQFSHDWEAPSYNVCTFYQKGMCTYGSRCRYEHVKLNRLESAASSSSSQRSHVGPDHGARFVRTNSYKARTVQGAPLECSTSSAPFVPTNKPAWIPKAGQHDPSEKSVAVETGNVKPEDLPLCSLAADGSCPNGNACPQVHCDLCPTCGKLCLHPFRPEEKDEHLQSCEKKLKYLETLKHSQEIECSVCLDRVLSKPTPAERKFGVLSECDHPFCISCIRNWRNSSPASGVDANSAVRACPVCRKVSYFVVPSVIWYTSKEEKQEIVDKYKAKLRLIDCKHFNFGNGNCPFGNSCFYKHTVKPGSYVWKYSKPPPRRRPAHSFSVMDFEDVDELCDLFDHLIDGDLDIFDPEDYEDYDDCGIDYLLLRQGLGLGENSDEENDLI